VRRSSPKQKPEKSEEKANLRLRKHAKPPGSMVYVSIHFWDDKVFQLEHFAEG
jgi:hypothetical protein